MESWFRDRQQKCLRFKHFARKITGTMKRLLLMRHAEAACESHRQSDFDRPLTPRGESDAASIGRAVAQARSLPGAIVTSPAGRAVRTAELFIEGADTDIEIRISEKMY